jgi:uncharacterized membrane protein
MTHRAAISAIPLALAVLAVAAPLCRAHPLDAYLIRTFFASVCHQDPARSFWILGAPMAVCVRCLGIYLGAAVGAWLPLRQSRGWVVAAVAANLLDVASEMAGVHGNLAGLRLALGMGLGAAAGGLVAGYVLEFRARRRWA